MLLTTLAHKQHDVRHMKVSSLKCKDQTFFKSTLSDDINMRCIVLIYKSTLSDDEESQKGSTKKMLYGKPVAGACMAFTIYIKFYHRFPIMVSVIRKKTKWNHFSK